MRNDYRRPLLVLRDSIERSRERAVSNKNWSRMRFGPSTPGVELPVVMPIEGD